MRFRLTVILLIISLVPLMLLGIFSYQRSAGVIETETQKLTNQLVGESNKVLNQQLNELVQISTMLYTNQRLLDLLNTEKSDSASENFKRESEIRDILLNITNSRPDLEAVSVINESGEIISTDRTVSDEAKPHEEAWFQEVIEASGELIWIPTHNEPLLEGTSQRWATYSLARSFNAITNVGKYVFLFDVRETSLSELLREMEISETGTIRIVDRDGNVISSLNEDELGTTEPSENYNFLDEEESGSLVENEQLISYAPLSSSGWFLVVEVPMASMLAQVKQIGIFTFVGVGLSAVAALIAAFIIGRQLARPIERMRVVMEQAGEGDLTAQAEILGKNEIAQLNDSFKELITRFRHFVGRTKGAGDDLKAVAEDLIKQAEQNNVTYREITEATESIAAGADQQAREAETSAELVGELLSKWRESLSEAEKLEQVMNDTVKVSDEGRNSIRELLEKNELTEQEIKRLTDNLELLEDRVGEVHNATNLIDDIMDQTKILALNAAIEAHRAGQDGRGFIVVADEIQRLSQQVLSATETIGGSIQSIQQAMKNTRNSMKLTNEAMEQQRHTVTGTDEAFHSIREQMDEAQSQLMSVMNTLSLVQQFEQKMSDAIQNISAVAEQSAAATEEVAALAKDQESSSDHLVKQSHSLAEVVNTLEEELARFRVEESADELDNTDPVVDEITDAAEGEVQETEDEVPPEYDSPVPDSQTENENEDGTKGVENMGGAEPENMNETEDEEPAEEEKRES